MRLPHVLAASALLALPAAGWAADPPADPHPASPRVADLRTESAEGGRAAIERF